MTTPNAQTMLDLADLIEQAAAIRLVGRTSGHEANLGQLPVGSAKLIIAALRSFPEAVAPQEPTLNAVREAVRQFWIRDVNKPSWFRDDQNEKLVNRIADGIAGQIQPSAMRDALEAILKWYGGDPDDLSDWSDCMLQARDALALPSEAAAVATQEPQAAGDFYLVPREIIDQFPEINVNNYDHDDACALNAWGCQVVTYANPALPSEAIGREADEDHPDCKTDRECELYDALMGLASHATAFHNDYKQWVQGGVTLEPIVSKALRLASPVSRPHQLPPSNTGE